MQYRITRSTVVAGWQQAPLGDRIVQGLIISSGVAVFLALAWVHLGLGALLLPPSAPPTHLTATAGGATGYVVTLTPGSGRFTVGHDNLVSVQVRDARGNPLPNAVVSLHADMMTMSMPVPDAHATADGTGRYSARLAFSMAGPWRLTVTIVAPGHPKAEAAFAIGVDWH